MTAFEQAWDVVKGYELIHTDEFPPSQRYPTGGVVEHWGGSAAKPYGEGSDLPEQSPITDEQKTEEPQLWFFNWCERRVILNDASGRPLGKVLMDDRGSGMPGYNTVMASSRSEALQNGQSPMRPFNGGYIWGLRIDPSTLRPKKQEWVNEYDKPYASAFNEIYSSALGIDPLPEDKDDEWDEYIEGGKGR